MDHSINIWSLTDPAVTAAATAAASFDAAAARCRRWSVWSLDVGSLDRCSAAFPTAVVQFPAYSTASVHKNYVDAVAWYGDLLLSKVRL
jgi:hypothetical protein